MPNGRSLEVCQDAYSYDTRIGLLIANNETRDHEGPLDRRVKQGEELLTVAVEHQRAMLSELDGVE